MRDSLSRMPLRLMPNGDATISASSASATSAQTSDK